MRDRNREEGVEGVVRVAVTVNIERAGTVFS
jgi:hypothetical protein